MNQNISIIIPAFNEEKHIAQVIENLLEHNYKIIVVDDCSTDNTFKVAKQFPITVLKHIVNRGQGAALQTGTDFAIKNNAEIIVHFDADGQHRIKDIAEIIKPILNSKADYVFGSRFLGKNSNLPFFKKNIIIPLAKKINYFFSGLKLTDAHNGLRAFNTKIADQIYLSQDGMAHNTEYPYLIKKNKIKYTEIPIIIIYNEFGQGIIAGFKILKELFLMKLNN